MIQNVWCFFLYVLCLNVLNIGDCTSQLRDLYVYHVLPDHVSSRSPVRTSEKF